MDTGSDVAKLDIAEFKIKRFRIERTIFSPAVLSLSAMLGLTLFCFFIGRSDWAAIVSTLLLGAGVFLYSLAKTVERLSELHKLIQSAETRLLRGEYTSRRHKQPKMTLSDSGMPVWEVSVAPDLQARLTADGHQRSPIIVDGRRLFDLWVEEGIRMSRGLPKLRTEMMGTGSYGKGERTLAGSLANPAQAPVLKVSKTSGFKVKSGKGILQYLLANKVPIFPVLAADQETLDTLKKYAQHSE